MKSQEDGNEIVIGNERLKQIVYEKQTPKGSGSPILSNLAGLLKTFGQKVLRIIKPLES